MKDGLFPPRQQRSRDSLARLLTATIETLEAHGLEGATIPRIARAAGVAPSSIYRRFEDRDALYRAALLDRLERSAAATAASVRLESFPDRTLQGVVEEIVAVTMRQYREQPGLMRAMTRYVERTADEAFRNAALAIVARNYGRLVELLLAFRGEIAHRNPRRAITFALLTMATLIEVRALEQVSMWHELLPLSDAELRADLVRIVLAYLRTPKRR